MRIATLCLITSLFPILAYASVEPKDKYICNCHITPSTTGKSGHTVEHTSAPAVHHHHHKAAVTPVTDKAPVTHHKRVHVAAKHNEVQVGEGYPGREDVITSNKLALPVGKSSYAPGELVYISGRVLDKKCVPVSDAIVDIWQANPEGKYVHASLGERLSPAPVFAGSGRATTDNLGRFNFVTVFPGSSQGRAPYIHIHVAHKDFPTLDTEMFFADDRRNSGDPVYGSLNTEQRTMLTAKVWQRDVNDPDKGLGASWDISLNGTNPWRHF